MHFMFRGISFLNKTHHQFSKTSLEPFHDKYSTRIKCALLDSLYCTSFFHKIVSYLRTCRAGFHSSQKNNH